MRIAYDATEIHDFPGEKGRGLIARRAIQGGELLDECPVHLYPEAQERGTWLEHYSFWWCEGIRALALGRVSLVNHSPRPNAGVELDPERKLIRLWARQAIAIGEEITFDYGCDLWFTPH